MESSYVTCVDGLHMESIVSHDLGITLIVLFFLCVGRGQ